MDRATLDSDAIDRIAYDGERAVLSIWFRETGRYLYQDVPGAVYEALRTAPSAGRYFNRCIKPRYRCIRDPGRRRFRPD